MDLYAKSTSATRRVIYNFVLVPTYELVMQTSGNLSLFPLDSTIEGRVGKAVKLLIYLHRPNSKGLS